MHETWLKQNQRAIVFACALPAALAVLGLWMVFAAEGDQFFWRALGIGLLLVNAMLIAMLIWQLRRPRIGYCDGQVLFYLRAGRPLQVPAEFVEAFFLGQGPARLPLDVGKQKESTNLVARLSQRQTEWAHQVVKPALGRWCDGYVTIFGTWCEPLGTETIRRLNRRLKEVKSRSDEASKP